MDEQVGTAAAPVPPGGDLVASQPRLYEVVLVQVFQGQAAIGVAIADGMARDQAQVLYVWVRNQNPRLRTLAMASDLQIDLLPGDCIESRKSPAGQADQRQPAMSNSRPAYLTLTMAGGVVHRLPAVLQAR